MQWETGKRYLISYEAESGQRTERQIDLLGISASHGDATCLRAFCHLRGEERTFRSDRIVSAVLVANSGRSY